jgi:pimeloyl-ACP methyl ester carboxylesterase
MSLDPTKGRQSTSLLATLALGAALFAPLPVDAGGPSGNKAQPSEETQVRYKTETVDGVELFYREAGPKTAPVVLLLHGFPSSSHMFRNLIPALADRYRVIAPDLPGFGFTRVPASARYTYSFANLAETVGKFTDALKLQRYAIYVFDYGAPVGYRLALRNPERLAAIISQNGNAYEEGLDQKGWQPVRTYWEKPTQENRDALREFFKLEATKWQYTHGAPDASLIAPESYTMDQVTLDTPGNAEIQLDLFGDYKSNVALYPKFQELFRAAKPPLLAVWGKNDPFFTPPGAQAYKRDIPGAEVHLLDTGHFALETHGPEIAALIRDFLGRNLK